MFRRQQPISSPSNPPSPQNQQQLPTPTSPPKFSNPFSHTPSQNGLSPASLNGGSRPGSSYSAYSTLSAPRAFDPGPALNPKTGAPLDAAFPIPSPMTPHFPAPSRGSGFGLSSLGMGSKSSKKHAAAKEETTPVPAPAPAPAPTATLASVTGSLGKASSSPKAPASKPGSIRGFRSLGRIASTSSTNTFGKPLAKAKPPSSFKKPGPRIMKRVSRVFGSGRDNTATSSTNSHGNGEGDSMDEGGYASEDGEGVGEIRRPSGLGAMGEWEGEDGVLDIAAQNGTESMNGSTRATDEHGHGAREQDEDDARDAQGGYSHDHGTSTEQSTQSSRERSTQSSREQSTQSSHDPSTNSLCEEEVVEVGGGHDAEHVDADDDEGTEEDYGEEVEVRVAYVLPAQERQPASPVRVSRSPRTPTSAVGKMNYNSGGGSPVSLLAGSSPLGGKKPVGNPFFKFDSPPPTPPPKPAAMESHQDERTISGTLGKRERTSSSAQSTRERTSTSKRKESSTSNRKSQKERPTSDMFPVPPASPLFTEPTGRRQRTTSLAPSTSDSKERTISLHVHPLPSPSALSPAFPGAFPRTPNSAGFPRSPRPLSATFPPHSPLPLSSPPKTPLPALPDYTGEDGLDAQGRVGRGGVRVSMHFDRPPSVASPRRGTFEEVMRPVEEVLRGTEGANRNANANAKRRSESVPRGAAALGGGGGGGKVVLMGPVGGATKLKNRKKAQSRSSRLSEKGEGEDGLPLPPSILLRTLLFLPVHEIAGTLTVSRAWAGVARRALVWRVEDPGVGALGYLAKGAGKGGGGGGAEDVMELALSAWDLKGYPGAGPFLPSSTRLAHALALARVVPLLLNLDSLKIPFFDQERLKGFAAFGVRRVGLGNARLDLRAIPGFDDGDEHDLDHSQERDEDPEEEEDGQESSGGSDEFAGLLAFLDGLVNIVDLRWPRLLEEDVRYPRGWDLERAHEGGAQTGEEQPERMSVERKRTTSAPLLSMASSTSDPPRADTTTNSTSPTGSNAAPARSSTIPPITKSATPQTLSAFNFASHSEAEFGDFTFGFDQPFASGSGSGYTISAPSSPVGPVHPPGLGYTSFGLVGDGDEDEDLFTRPADKTLNGWKYPPPPVATKEQEQEQDRPSLPSETRSTPLKLDVPIPYSAAPPNGASPLLHTSFTFDGGVGREPHTATTIGFNDAGSPTVATSPPLPPSPSPASHYSSPTSPSSTVTATPTPLAATPTQAPTPRNPLTSRTLLPALTHLHAPPGLVVLLCSAPRPLTHLTVSLSTPLYAGFKPGALWRAVRWATDTGHLEGAQQHNGSQASSQDRNGVEFPSTPTSSSTLTELTLLFTRALDKRTREKALRVAGAVLGGGLACVGVGELYGTSGPSDGTGSQPQTARQRRKEKDEASDGGGLYRLLNGTLNAFPGVQGVRILPSPSPMSENTGSTTGLSSPHAATSFTQEQEKSRAWASWLASCQPGLDVVAYPGGEWVRGVEERVVDTGDEELSDASDDDGEGDEDKVARKGGLESEGRGEVAVGAYVMELM